MAKRPKLTLLQYHEAMDRAFLFGDNLDRHLLQHPVCKLDKEFGTLIEEATDKIYAAYQLAGHRQTTIIFP